MRRVGQNARNQDHHPTAGSAPRRLCAGLAIALAWLLRHPSRMVPIIGSTNPDRIREATLADSIELTREEWYSLLTASRGKPLP